MVTAYIGLGSNIASREKNIKEALLLLKKDKSIKILEVSSFKKTKAVGPKQRDFINAAAKLDTLLSVTDFLKRIKKIEKELGRKKTMRWGPRIIDIDILFYGNKIIKNKKLCIPHKELQNRGFVLEPLSEIANDLIHPVLKKSVEQLKNSLSAG